MIAVNQNGLLYMTNAALPHLLEAAKDGLREVADIVNISSIAGRQAWANFGVYNMTKIGVNGFTEALRQEVTKKHVRVGVLEPGAVDTELVSHNNDTIKDELAASDEIPEPLRTEDIAENITLMVTRPRRSSIAELWAMPTSQDREPHRKESPHEERTPRRPGSLPHRTRRHDHGRHLHERKDPG